MISRWSVVLALFAAPLFVTCVHGEEESESNYKVVELSSANLDAAIASGPVVFQLYAHWCKHCHKFAPYYHAVAERLGPEGVTVARADGSVSRILVQRFGTTGFPSFYLLEGGKAFEFVGDRSVESLVGFARSHGASMGKEMSGLTGPASPVWKVAALFLTQWERVVSSFKESEMSTAALGASFAALVVVILVAFGVVIHFVTKPAPVRPKTN